MCIMFLKLSDPLENMTVIFLWRLFNPISLLGHINFWLIEPHSLNPGLKLWIVLHSCLVPCDQAHRLTSPTQLISDMTFENFNLIQYK